jgi:hypothetical protein
MATAVVAPVDERGAGDRKHRGGEESLSVESEQGKERDVEVVVLREEQLCQRTVLVTSGLGGVLITAIVPKGVGGKLEEDATDDKLLTTSTTAEIGGAAGED